MQHPRTCRVALKRSAEHVCRCSVCGAVVWPYPLPLSPELHLVRGYPRARASLDRRTWTLRFDPLLWCSACAPPLVVQWWIRWERMASELLETLPSIPDDVEAAGEANPNAGELSTDVTPGARVDAKATVYNRVALT